MTAGRWLAIVIAFVVLLGGGYATFRLSMDRHAHFAREAALKDNLYLMRSAIDNFRKERGRFPHSLEELVPNYLRRIPRDPITGQANWRVVTEDDVQPNTDFTTSTTKSESYVVDVHSGAGAPYSEW